MEEAEPEAALEEIEVEETTEPPTAYLERWRDKKWDKVGEVIVRRGSMMYSWEKMLLQLSGRTLYMYIVSKLFGRNNIILDAQEVVETPDDVLLLDETFEFHEMALVSVTGKKNAFQLTSKRKGISYVMCAESPDERDAWLVALHFAAHEQDGATISQNLDVASKEAISVCSYNVNFALCDLSALGTEEPEIMKAMRDVNADIICLQETTPDWEYYLTAHLQDEYSHCLFRHHTVGLSKLPPAGGIGLLSKHPFTEIALIESPVGWFPGHLVMLHSPLGDIQILNLHLRPPITRTDHMNSPPREVSMGKTFQSALPLPPSLSKTERSAECKHYAQFIDWDLPLIVCGDFNESETSSSSMFWCTNMGLSSALVEFEDKRPTWWWQLPGGIKVTGRYDHIFYNTSLTCVQAEVHHGKGESDHYPVVATFTATHPDG